MPDEPRFWPTPKVAADRSSRAALTARHWCDLALAQAVEVTEGILPRELDSPEQLPPKWRPLWPTPKSCPSGPDYARANRPRSGGDDLATAVARVQKGPLSPEWVELLMGYPPGWTAP
jgi:DNA (cytosine-5)-methyltransferase 1